MLFRKQSVPQGRTRPASTQRPARREPVFSYYANRSVRTQNNTRHAEGMPSLKRLGDSEQLRRRLYSLGVLVVIVLLLGASLRLQTTPKVVTVDLGTDKQLFLRDRSAYEHAAQRAFASSLFDGNKLTVNTGRIIDEMRRQFPELLAVSITLPVTGSRPIMYIQPAQPKLILSTKASGVFLLNGSGRALMNAAQVPDLAKLGAPVVSDESGITISEGQIALPSATVAFVSEVAGQLQAKNVSVSGYTLTTGANQLQVRVNGVPYYIKFDVHGNAREEVGAYLAAKQKMDSQKVTPKEYVDVRVENRVYFK